MPIRLSKESLERIPGIAALVSQDRKKADRTVAKAASESQRISRVLFLQASGLPKPETEFRFHPSRRWRFDFAWPAFKVALEVHGGVWIHGHHSRGKNQMDDWEKLNAAQLLGWQVFQCSPQQIDSGAILQTLRKAMDQRAITTQPGE